jgi:flagellar biosynthetic protein FlhB
MAGDNRTEAATPKRRSEARKRGQVPRSPDLSSLFVLFGLVLAMPSLFSNAALQIALFFRYAYTHLLDTPPTVSTLMQLGASLGLTVVKAIGPLVALAAALGVAINLAQTGPLFAFQRMQPDLNRLNPLNGITRYLSLNALVELIKALCKLLLVGWLCYNTIHSAYPLFIVLTRVDLLAGVQQVLETARQMAIRVALTMLAIAVLDYAYQRYAYERSLRMTKDEVKQEHKQLEGSPLVRSRIRSRQRQMARKRMMNAVPTADVVVTNPTHYAVALKYEPERMNAPIVVAKGQDLVALKIRELAQEHDVPIVENPPLARTLYRQVPLEAEIPPDLYAAVAEVMAFVYRINEERRQRRLAHRR